MKDLQHIKCFLFDMDGTIYLGNDLLPGMPEFFPKLQTAGKKFFFLTNNSSRTHAEYVTKLSKLGFPAERESILISTDGAMAWLQEHCPGGKLFISGQPGFEKTFREAGFCLTEGLEDPPDYILLAFDKTLTYDKLEIICRLIDRGVPFLATHPDVRCPMEGGEFVPDLGGTLALIKAATKREPLEIFGKPYGHLVNLVMSKTGCRKDEIAMVGDRLNTDIAFGKLNGLTSILVLSGETRREDVAEAQYQPDVILENTQDILGLI